MVMITTTVNTMITEIMLSIAEYLIVLRKKILSGKAQPDLSASSYLEL